MDERALALTPDEVSRILDWHANQDYRLVRPEDADLADKLWAWLNDEGDCESP